jgi:hypothetical protein
VITAWKNSWKKKRQSGDAPSVGQLYVAITGYAWIAASICCSRIKNTAGTGSDIMDSLNNYISQYREQLGKGHIQKAYKAIMTFMSGLGAYLGKAHPAYSVSALYFGYMDMTYFAFTPPGLKSKKLKIAIVYLHEQGRFEAWLGAINRKIQAQYIELLSVKNTGEYKLSKVMPGVDSIIESIIVCRPDFEKPEELKIQIEKKTLEFIDDITSILDCLQS